ncbi:MAG TPA: hypothetical protein VGQ59_00105 [Cyclobacteriaceae bacterium]|jgi:hypothetical protein|nr:hypothetical protein [Cyclobacteriaceae bacterium]
MKTSILFCCLMIVGSLAFGQKQLTPDPPDAVNPGTPVTAPSTSTGSGVGSSSGSSASSGGGGGGGSTWFFSPDDLEGIADLISGWMIALAEEEDD